MATKNNIEILISATDEASKVLKETTKEVTNFAKNSKSISEVREENKGKITASATAIFAGVGYYLKQGIDDINDYNYYIQRLTTLTKNSTGATKKEVDALVKQAEALEKVGVASKDNIVAGMSQFATFDMSTEAISALTEAYVDYVVAEKGATASSEEYISMASGLAQALQGNYASLSRAGFILDEETKSLIESGNEMERVNAIVDVLNSTYKGFNETIALTAEGQQILLKRSLDDIRETIASEFLPIVTKITEVMATVISKIGERVSEHPKLSASILGLVGAFAGLVAIIGAVSFALPAITTAIGLLSGPIGIVIGALTALGVAYSNNLFGFRDAVHYLRTEISPVLDQLATTFKTVFNQIWTAISDTYKKIEPILIPIWNEFRAYITEVLKTVVVLVADSFKAIGVYISGLVKTFGEVISFLNNVFTGNWKGALDNLVNITGIGINTVVGIFNAFGVDLPAIFETLKSTITGIWNNLFSSLKDICKGAVDWISDKVSKVWDKINAAREAIASLRGGGSSGGRASGGRVIAGQTYRVNEIHGEYFTPAVNGTISPAPSNSPSISINFGDVTVSDQQDIDYLVEKMKEELIGVYQNIRLGNI